MKVLVVEDDKKIIRFIKKGLEEQGFTVETSTDGDDGLFQALENVYDVLVLDIMLPGKDGLSILRSLRDKGNTVPVLLLTARGELSERLEGLNLGADDYMTKPFFVEELVARLHALVRRASGISLSVMQEGSITVNMISREVKVVDEMIELTGREFNLLEYLMRTPGRIFTRTQILEHVWGYDFDPQTNIVDVYIQRLRRKLGEGAGKPIETVRGVGYRFKKQDEG